MTERHTTASRGTRADIRLTRAPADTPRARLHRAAARGARAAREVGKTLAFSADDAARLRGLARRGLGLLAENDTRGARLVRLLCGALDQALAALGPLLETNVTGICEELTGALVQLEAAEEREAKLRAEVKEITQALAFERSHNEQLRGSLAAEQVRAAALLRDIPADRFDEPTCSRTFTPDEKAAIDDLGGGTMIGMGGRVRTPAK